MRADLHMHTWISDGDVSPSEVVALAGEARLDFIAITDHDTAAGVEEGVLASADLTVVVVPGIEISTRLGEEELHILGYWIDPTSPSIMEHQRRAVLRRSTRMAAMVERLQGLGIGITYGDVEEAAGPTVKTLGRPHLARALHARKYTRFYSEAFVRFIGDSGPAFVAEGFPSPEYAVDVIHAAGGVAVWAHPAPALMPTLLPVLAGYGLDGVECFRPAIELPELNLILRAAREFGLFPTGGSDWHGPTRSRLGDFAVEASHLHEVLAIGGVEVAR